MDTELKPVDLTEAVLGHLDAFAAVAAQPHGVLQRLRDALPQLVLTTDAVCRVLTTLQANPEVGALVQRWASFVKRGYVAGALDHPVVPIAIDYDLRAEDQIVEVVSRLDEIGDPVDGEISREEVGHLLRSLCGAARQPAARIEQLA